MTRSHKVHYFESEGRENLPMVIKSIKLFIKGLEQQCLPKPKKIVFLTLRGEGPMLAYNQFQKEDISFIAVTFPRLYGGSRKEGSLPSPEIPEKARKFFDGVGIAVLTHRLPWDEIVGATFHNREMELLHDALGLFGASMPMAIQAVLQATDSGHVEVGEQVIVATGDTALLVTASTTQMCFRKDYLGFAINEIICKPNNFTGSRKRPEPPKPSAGTGKQIEGNKEQSTTTAVMLEGNAGIQRKE